MHIMKQIISKYIQMFKQHEPLHTKFGNKSWHWSSNSNINSEEYPATWRLSLKNLAFVDQLAPGFEGHTQRQSDQAKNVLQLLKDWMQCSSLML